MIVSGMNQENVSLSPLTQHPHVSLVLYLNLLFD